MYVSVFFKTLFVGCVLYFTFADAKLADVTSVVSSLVGQSLSVRQNSNAKQIRRFKREKDTTTTTTTATATTATTTTKTLDDPKGCIYQCGQDESKQMINATMKNMAKLISLALQDVDFTGDQTDTPEKEASFKKQIEDKTISNMGPFFDDLCKVAQNTDACYGKCPDTQLRKIMTLKHSDAEVFCEPGKNWINFTMYWNAINCTNGTEEQKPCDTKCGTQTDIANVTSLKVEDPEDDGTKVTFGKDIKTNMAAIGPVCKTISCDIDCYKPIMSEKCGPKAYELYARMSKVDPRSTLDILEELKAVGDNKDCKQFQ